MQIIESIKMALYSLVSNKLRSVLTLLGISIGLFAILIVMTSIRAIQNSVEDIFSELGTNNFVIQKYPAIRMGHGFINKYRNRKDLTIEQGERLKKITELPEAVGISEDVGGKVVKYRGNSTNPDVEIWGTNLDEIQALEMEIEQGRSFNQSDMEFGRNCCIIGSKVREKLFGSIDPLGEEIKVDGMVLEIIGVFKERGGFLGSGQDNLVSIPLEIFIKNYGKDRNYNYLVRASEGRILETMDEIISALRVIRKVGLTDENDFELITNEQLVDQFNDITKYFKIGAGVIAFIALVAAGVGIMNIMLVSVTERTREIGIRKAIGAKKIVIRMQFVIEAIVLSQVGGLIGISLGLIGGNIVAGLLKVSAALPIDWVIIGLLITTGVGIVFGSYPAIKASNLDPIEALRYE